MSSTLKKKLFSLIDLIFRELLCSHQHWEESRVPISPHTPCPPRHTWHTHTASSAINTIHMLHSMNQRGHIINNYRKCFWVCNIQFCLKAQNAIKRYTSLSSPTFLATSLPPQRSILWRYNYTCSKSPYTILIKMNSMAYYIHSNVP